MDEKETKKLLGLRIKQLRKKNNLTQFGLGELVGIDQRQIAYIEGGNSFPTVKTLNRICSVFGCKLKDLFDYEHLENTNDLRKELTAKIEGIDEKYLHLYKQILTFIENNL